MEVKYEYGLFHIRHMEDSWKKNMADEFKPSWINVLDKIIMECYNKFDTGLMCVKRKSHIFGNKRHTICCGIPYILRGRRL